MNPRYTALPLIASVLKLLAAIVLVVGLASAAWALLFGAWPGFWSGHVHAAGNRLLSAAIRGIVLWAIAELVHVALDIEENTRRAADAVAKTGAIDTAATK